MLYLREQSFSLIHIMGDDFHRSLLNVIISLILECIKQYELLKWLLSTIYGIDSLSRRSFLNLCVTLIVLLKQSSWRVVVCQCFVVLGK